MVLQPSPHLRSIHSISMVMVVRLPPVAPPHTEEVLLVVIYHPLLHPSLHFPPDIHMLSPLLLLLLVGIM